MGILKKLIGLFFLIIIFFILIKSKGILNGLNNLALGPTETPTQVGVRYTAEDSSIGIFRVVRGQGNQAFGAVTVARNGNVLSLSAENIQIPSGEWGLWLTDTSSVTDQTRYIDFGKIVPPYSINEYRIGLRSTVDLNVYRYVLIINPQTFDVYAVSTLKR